MKTKSVKTKLRRDDTVIVLTGKDKGKRGRILRIDRAKGRVLVEGINMVKKAQRRKSQNESGGIIEIEAAIDISNVMYVTKDGKPSKLGYREEGEKKMRFARKTGEVV